MNLLRNLLSGSNKITFNLNDLSADLFCKSGKNISYRLLDLGDDLIVKEIKANGWEKGSVYFWTKIISLFKFVNIVDMGAYNGIYGILAKELAIGLPNVIFIEANPFVFQRLVSNLRINGINTGSAKWTAISKTNCSEVSLALRLSPTDLTTAGSINEDLVADRFNVLCPNTSILDFLSSISGASLFKIDVEGAEEFLVESIFKHFNDSIFIGLIEILNKKSFDAIAEMSKTSNFILHGIDEKSKTLGECYQFNESCENRNYLIFSKKAVNIFNSL